MHAGKCRCSAWEKPGTMISRRRLFFTIVLHFAASFRGSVGTIFGGSRDLEGPGSLLLVRGFTGKGVGNLI